MLVRRKKETKKQKITLMLARESGSGAKTPASETIEEEKE